MTPNHIPLATGNLTPEQIDLMLTTLPVEITLVDENDRVVYYSHKKEMIFQRDPAIIGNSVQDCHPPHVVATVQKLLDDFRVGRRDMAEFWYPSGERFIYIRYYALRDGQGVYRGNLEVMEEVSAIRALQGERRTLDG